MFRRSIPYIKSKCKAYPQQILNLLSFKNVLKGQINVQKFDAEKD